MANYELMVPKLGEGIIEATLIKWLKNEGDMILEEDTVVEIATDKVDSEIPSPVAGKLVKKLYGEGDIIPVGKVFAIIEIAGAPVKSAPVPPAASDKAVAEPAVGVVAEPAVVVVTAPEPAISAADDHDTPSGTRFYSPLVRSIAQQENIPFGELDSIAGTGKGDRITKQDILDHIKNRHLNIIPASAPAAVSSTAPTALAPAPATVQQVILGEDGIVEMDRIRQLIAAHMVKSVQTSAHVTSFMEVDMSRAVQWRDKNKDAFLKKEKEKLTFTPIFIEAIAMAVRDFPMVNVSVDGPKIIVHKNINVGMAVALPNFNLIVPVIRNADQKSLLGLVKHVNDLAERARTSKLVPDEITSGTISLTNLGSFGTLMGTPIINQPQTAIIAVGAIKKRPVVIETPEGDVIGIRPMMIISVTYDHRVIDGSLGGQFLARVARYLENFDTTQTI